METEREKLQVDLFPNILILVDQNPLRWSTQEDFALAMTKRLKSLGAACVVTYSTYPPKHVESVLKEAGAELEVARLSDAGLLGFCLKVRRLCFKYNIGLIHMRHYGVSTPLTFLLPLLVPCKVVLTDNFGGKGRGKNILKNIIAHGFNRLMNHWVERIVAPSLFVRDREIRFRGISEKKVVCIINGIDLNRFRPYNPTSMQKYLGLSDGQQVIFSAGNLFKIKGMDVLINAFSQINGRYPNTILVIAGDGSERTNLEKLALELGLSKKVKFLGNRGDVETLVSGATIFCCPSVFPEAFGLVNAEAMASEVPVVSTTIGGIPEVVKDGECGFLVPPGDVNELSSAIMKLLSSPELRKTMGKAGRKRAEELFDLSRNIDQYVELYRQFVKSSR